MVEVDLRHSGNDPGGHVSGRRVLGTEGGEEGGEEGEELGTQTGVHGRSHHLDYLQTVHHRLGGD